eukprot:12231431-Alexandrium_andersonii.AAC.1
MQKWVIWVSTLAWQNVDVRHAHEVTARDPRQMPPPQVRQMGNTMEEVQRVMDNWKRSLGEEQLDYRGAWWGKFPPEQTIPAIRNFLGMPALEGPEFAGILREEWEDTGA